MRMMWMKKNRRSEPAACTWLLTEVSPHERHLAGGVRRRCEEPRLDRVPRSGHRRLDPRAVEEQVIEQEGVSGLELRPHHGRVDGEMLDDGRADGPVEDRAAGAGLNDPVEAPRQEVDSGGIDASSPRARPRRSALGCRRRGTRRPGASRCSR